MMSKELLKGLMEINEAYGRLKELTKTIITIYKLKNAEIVVKNYDFLEEIGVIEDE